MYLPSVLHPDVVDFLRNDLELDIQERVWNCIERVKQQQFSSSLRVKKLKGISKRVWEARITDASRLIFTYEKSRQPDTGKAQVYIAVQDICLDHDDVSRIAKARNKTSDALWLDAEELVEEKIGNLERDRAVLTLAEQSALNAAQVEELLLPPDFTDELLGNIQWRVLESESEWHHAIIQQDADLPLKLTPEEYQLAHLPGDLLLSGSAGTGKTTVALYRMLPEKQDSLSGRRLYVAYNPLLVSNAQEQFKRLVGNTDIEIDEVLSVAPGGSLQENVDSIFHFKTLRNLCLEILEASGQLYIPEDEVNFQVFCDLYRAHPQKGKYPAALAWDEVRSIIKGSHLSTGSDLLYKKEYERLGSKRSTVIQPDQRHEVYQLAEWYQKRLKQKEDERFDEIDLARKVLQIVKQGGTNRYQLIVCDEVQDFTELQLELLFQLVAEDGNLFFAGDLHQMISPSGFRWEDLKQKFYHAHREVEQKNLNVNFRSVGTLVNLANQLLKLRSKFLGTSVGETSQSAGSYGQLARLTTASTESLKVQLQSKLNPGDAILVRTDTDKEKLRSDFQSSFIFTVEEAKGLEFDTVFLVEFFKPTQELWGKVLRGGLLKDKEKPHLQLELNLLYVAITRARRILNIWESRPSQVWSQRELAGCVLLESAELVNSARYEPTPESWREQGLYYLKAEFYQQAMECFEKSGDTLLQRKANALLLVQQREYNKAAEILTELQEWRDAARMFEKVKQWQQAASCWANADNSQRQQLCEISGLEVGQQWEDAAQRWEALERDEDAERCRMNIPEKKAELRAIEFEQKGQWLKAAEKYELAKLLKKAVECRAKEFEKRKQWEQAAQQYELAEMLDKAEDCRNKIQSPSLAVNTQNSNLKGNTRILRFPTARSVGKLNMSNRGGWTSDDTWQELGEARGDVTVPRNKKMQLNANSQASSDLSFLEALEPDDLYTILNLSNVDDNELLHISQLTELHSLDLRMSRISDAGLVHLQNLTSLVALGLSITNVGNEGMKYLQGLNNLKRLFLSDTQVGDLGLSYLRELTELEDLNLTNTNVSDAGLNHLKGMRKLERLTLVSTHVSEVGVNNIKRVFPRCEILWLPGGKMSPFPFFNR